MTLSNTGTGPLAITSIVASGDYAQTNTCGSSVAAGANCQMDVTFTPTGTGTRAGAVTITDNASDSPQTVNLSGTGVAAAAPVVSLSTTSLVFADQEVSTTSAPQAVTLSNTGTGPLAITSIVASGDYAQTNTCGSSVAAGANCQMDVTFTPTGTGTRAGAVTITDNASDSPQTVNLSGTGVAAAAPVVSLSTTSLVFADQEVSTTSAPQAVTLSNTGTGPLAITSIVASGDYAQTNTCGSSVAAGANCQMDVTFTPTGTGTRAGAVTITDNASDSPQTVNLSGTGVAAAAPVVSLSTTSLVFADQEVSTTSAPQAVTLSNTGTGPLAITSIVASGDYAQTNTCGSSVAAGANCQMDVTFTPTGTGTRAGAVTIADNASDSPQVVSLSGTGTTPPAPAVSLSPTELDFGKQLVATASPAQTVTMSNVGTGPLTISSVQVSGAFAQTNTCASSLAPGASCSIDVTFISTSLGRVKKALTVTNNAPDSPQTLSLTGIGSRK